MLDNIEGLLKVLFFIMSFVWIGKIMILRSDKQIVINPLLISIAAILVVLPQDGVNAEVLGIGIQNLRIILYFIYIMIVLFGIYCVKKKNGVF